ncbi:MAG: protein kinase [Deltaproteobacteria bacterium]|nr:protein kinase [Deltaproteobacteria bacterium]
MKVCPLCGGAYPVEEGFCPMDGKRLRTRVAANTLPVAAPAEAFARSLLGQVLDRRYRLDEVIGEGGMGVVFRATHVLIGKRFAVKVLRPEHLDAAELVQRFLLEAKVASSLKHPNVVEITDFGELPGGGAFYAMELLEGRSLAQTIDAEGAFSPIDAGIIGLQVAQGLAAAHAQGVVHRDLKPDNVFLCLPRRGAQHPVAKLLDFGIARVGPRRITVMGAVLGTPEYMSPEMAMGLDVDARADLYAFGVLMFEMLTGTVPFYHREVAKTLELQVRGPRPTLASRKPELAALVRVGELVETLMAVDRETRPASAEIVVRSLAASLHHDLDREAVEVVSRATKAIGSNLLVDLLEPRADVPWPAAQGRSPEPPTAAIGPAAAVVAAPPVPMPPARAGARTAAVAAVVTACIAGAATFGVAQWLRRPASDEAAGAESPPAQEASILAAPALTPAVLPMPTPVTAVPGPALADPGSVAPVGAGPTALPGAANADAMPSAADLDPAAARASVHAKSDPSIERTKTQPRRAADKRDRTKTVVPATAPAAADPPPTPPSRPEDDAPSTPKDPPAHKGPRDLKDPFPSK